MHNITKFFGDGPSTVSGTTGSYGSILFHLHQSLAKLAAEEGPDVTLLRTLMGQILKGFHSSSLAYSLQTRLGQTFDFMFIPADEMSKYGAIQVTKRIPLKPSQLVWRMPFVAPSILNEGLTEEAKLAIYSIDEQNQMLLRDLFRKEQTAQREKTYQVLHFVKAVSAQPE